MSKQKFIQDLKDKCEKHGISLHLVPEKHIIHEGEIYGGWFDPYKNELKCSYRDRNKPQLELLVHESCHLDQHIQMTKIWYKSLRNNVWEKWYKWMNGSDYSPAQVRAFMTSIQLVEWECECMSVEKIKKYKLPIDLARYKKKANSYILLYTLMRETRKWPDRKGPYRFPSIINKMRGDRILSDFGMSEELKELYKLKIYK